MALSLEGGGTMPVAPTYPGVYIEEIPSGVHTLTGVSTSITAFIGYTARGPVDQAVHIFSFADFERAFGGLAVDSPLSYAVKLFFQNGGNEAYIVRVAQGAARARTVLQRLTSGGNAALQIDAVSEGTWGNNLRISVDYDTINPASLFNLTVIELVEQNGLMVPGRIEVFRNLGMNSFGSNYAERTINAGSDLVRATRVGAMSTSAGTSVSGQVATAAALDPVLAMSRGRVAYLLNGQGPFEFDAHTTASPLFAAGDSLQTRLNNLATRVAADAAARFTAGALTFTPAVAGDQSLTFTTGATGERAAINFLNAATDNIAPLYRLGLANGGRETDGASVMRPAQSGTTGGLLGAPADSLTPPLTAAATGTIRVEVMRGTIGPVVTFDVALWGTGSGSPVVPAPTTVQEVLNAFAGAIARTPQLAGATVSVIDRRFRLQGSPGAEPNGWYRFANAGGDTSADEINLIAADADENLAHYSPGSGAVTLAQSGVVAGSNGTAPTPAEFRGSPAAKRGLYALEDVDLFNILCLPDVDDVGVLSEAIAYCVRRRAFIIIDLPGTVDTLPEAQAWLTANANLRSRNAAAYFPRIRAQDPLLNSIVRTFPPSGAVAGIYARTDAERGVWKAPAGTSATVVGAVGLAVLLTDPENGVLNPLGLNVLRTFPVYGTVSWGARTLRGADQLADEYKYIPVRRLALFLEESLYRGTQWAVFEPNDEPLWAQIRLNLGAFMHTLFAQGAFQGRTPREAYFVKCDKETTTQNDIDLGRVNIVVGFAPLKPAEFVIIQIQQIAGAIQT
jgi:phage tail sheath protein FI